eukprot:TRINITY_DN13529_c0_g1_i1.p1 TRINITY_DN13529_c0_g1~~TRINITY_DN13529_c0_g1_i1.p1  ORF type:complete len:752 (+),score=425.30 TRINITY_DN13529_c0_g1_i1:55-2310(+)
MAYMPTSSSSVGSQVSDTDEEEAKERAKEILTDFLRIKARNGEVERQLHRAYEENEGLIRLLQDKKYEMARDREQHAAELDDVRRTNHDLQQKVEASKHEIRKVAQTCAQRTADTAVHLQNKESECDSLEEELLALKDGLRETRAENDRLRLEKEELERLRGEVPEKAQQRIAELARRILEISKEKSAADQMILEGNDKVAAAMKTVEEFRQMQRDTDARLQETERARESDRARYEATIRGLQQELEMQTTLYKKYVEKLGQSPLPGTPSSHPVGQFHDPALGAQPLSHVLEAKLQEKDHHIRELQEALAQSRQHLEDHWKTSLKEKQSTYEQLRDSQKDSDMAMQQMRQDLEAAQDKIRALAGEKKNFESLMELYEQVKAERDELRKECFSAAVEAETAKRTQTEMSESLRQQQIDRAAQEKLAEELFKEKEIRENLERNLKAKAEQFSGELALKDKQLDMHQDAYRQGQRAGRDEGELRIREVEREKVLLQEELGRLQGELVRMQELAHREKDTLASKDKEIKDWCSAFQTAEKHKVSMGQQAEELKADKQAVQQEKSALELRCSVLQQHVDRVEKQLRDEQERNERMATSHAEKELNLAQKEYEFREREMRLREQSSKQKEILERDHQVLTQEVQRKAEFEVDRWRREAEIRDSASKREQERLLEQAASELAAKELEISMLKKELVGAKGQHLSGAAQVAALGHAYPAAPAAGAGAGADLRNISPTRVHGGRSLSPAHHNPYYAGQQG